GIRDFHVTGVQTCALPIFANVNLTNANHRYVSLDKSTKTLKSAFNGKGLILTRNPTGPSLISIEGDIGVRLVRFELLGSMFGGRSEERRVGKACRAWRAPW